MSERKSLSVKTRFEVFKRDKFTCQYCGAKAPEVVLHCDHIHPVAAGGTNDIMNLIAACAACNGGKGARMLDDSSAVERQRAQIEELEARREQLEMMLQWRDQAQTETVDTVDAVAQRIGERGGNFWPNESGKADIRKWLKRFSLAEILTALDESFDHYMKWIGDKPDEKSWEIAFSKIPAIASLNRQALEKPYMPKLAYIQGIVRKRIKSKYFQCLDVLEDYHLQGAPLDWLERLAKGADSWTEIADAVEGWLSLPRSDG